LSFDGDIAVMIHVAADGARLLQAPIDDVGDYVLTRSG
jgi:hypothetical protein